MVSEKIWGSAIGAFVAYGKDGATLVPVKVNADGELVVNLEAATVNIGDVDIQTLPSGNLGQQHKSASLSTAPADDIADATYIGDIKFGESVPAGTAIIGKVGIDQATANANEVVIKSMTAGPLPDTAASDLAHIHAAAESIKTAVEGATPAGTAIIGKVGIDKTTPGTTNQVTVDGTGQSADVKVSLDSEKVAISGIDAGSNIIGKVGIDQATANANEVVVKSIIAGDPKLGTLVDGQAPVVAGYKTKRMNVVFTGMDATSQYDAVGALVEIPNWATANGRSATIREIGMSCNNNAIAPQFEIHFYRAADVTVAADNASWTELAAEYDKRAGYILMPAMTKPAGSGTIDLVRCQNDDYGNGMSKEVTCAADSTSIWAKLKLMTSGISFAGTPGNTIVVAMVIEQS